MTTRFLKILTRSLLGVAAFLGLALAFLWARPPELLRVGAGYAAKIVCSNVFLANRDAGEVLHLDVQAPGNPLLRLVVVSVDRERGLVRANLLGFIGGGLAAYRTGVGCATVPDGDLDKLAGAPSGVPLPTPAAAAADRPWPQGSAAEADQALDAVLADTRLTGPGMRAVLVAQHGHLIAEHYGRGFDRETRLLGWSMTKSVNAGLIGLLVKDGKLALTDAALWPGLPPDDPHQRIRVADLLAMTSGLSFNEEYDGVSDVSRMLFLEPDMAAFARAQPVQHPPGAVWHYSTGTSMILSRILEDRLGASAVVFSHARLFGPLGMTSAVLETDARGTVVGGSYLYASAQDWLRYGQLLVQDGVWNGEPLLPPGYVGMMATPVAGSGGQYAAGQLWRWASDPVTPGVNPDTAFGIPADTFYLEGHDGQTIAVIPSRRLVILRMGLTPERGGYRPQPLIQAVLAALNGA